MIFRIAYLLLLLSATPMISAATLRQLWSVSMLGHAGSSFPSVCYGTDGSFGFSWPQGPAGWVSSNGTLLYSTNSSGSKVDYVSNNEMLLRVNLPTSVLYLTNSSGTISEYDLGILNGLQFIQTPQNQNISYSAPIFFQYINDNNASVTINCFTVDGTSLIANNTTNGPKNNLSSPILGKNGLTVTAYTTNAPTLTIQLSTNLLNWQNVFTIEAPKSSQTVTVPLNGQTNLFLRLFGQ